MAKLRVLVADDHPVIREALRLIINGQPEWEVCGVAKTGPEALELTISFLPNVVVLDLHMPEMDGLSVARQIKKRAPSVELVVFTGERGEEIVNELFEAGVRSFIRKTDVSGLLVEAIDAAARHKPFFTPEISDILFSRMMAASPGGKKKGRCTPLSLRERETLVLVAQGKSNKEIATRLRISSRTVEAHRASVIRKFGVSSTAEMVCYAIRNGIIEA
jgi:two-component system response regulator NreC